MVTEDDVAAVITCRPDPERYIVTGHFVLAEVTDALRARRAEPGSVRPIVVPWMQ